MAFTGNITDPSQKNLDLYTGEVLSEFDRVNVFLNTITKRTISGGDTAQFIVTGASTETDVVAHTPGVASATSVMKVDERKIAVSTRYKIQKLIDGYQEKVAQFDSRGELARQNAAALSMKIDKDGFVGLEAFISTDAGVADQTAGTVLTADLSAATTSEAKGDLLVAKLFEAQIALNTKNVPDMDRKFVTTNANYYNIVNSGKATNVNFTENNNGGIDTGSVMKVAGLPIIVSNHLPAAATNTFALHGIVYTPDVYGVVEAMGITSEANYLPKELATLLTSYYALGMGGLNPACGVVITEEA